MYMDNDLELSSDQAITATAASTNYVDGAVAEDIGAGEPVKLEILITETFTLLTSLNFALQSDDNTSFSSATTHVDKDVTLASGGLAAGSRVHLGPLPMGFNERYWRLYYTVTGTNPGAGKITAAVVVDKQSNA